MVSIFRIDVRPCLKISSSTLRSSERLPVVIKGLSRAAADAEKAGSGNKVHGIMLSNHGGSRSLDTIAAGPPHPPRSSTASVHPSFRHAKIYIDGGVTRGTYILKALALGATSRVSMEALVRTNPTSKSSNVHLS